MSQMNKVLDVSFDNPPSGAIVHDIKSRATKFLSCDFIHVKRCCSEATHVLAKFGEHDIGSC